MGKTSQAKLNGRCPYFPVEFGYGDRRDSYHANRISIEMSKDRWGFLLDQIDTDIRVKKQLH
jgi:hypothetical protein